MISDQKWRLGNLYRIVDKNSNSLPFRLNYIQQHVYDNLHSRNLILKSRQVGMSTWAVLYLMDRVLFTENLHAGIVSYSLEHAQHIFKKIIGHALDTLPPPFKSLTGIVQRSAREITFNNGSSLRVDTTLRGGSYPLTLISEFGKTCARNPQKAEEIVTGTLQAVPIGGQTIIESTGEGMEGYFAEMVMAANRRGNENLNPLEYKLFFYPWMDEPSYQLEDTSLFHPPHLNDYFKKIEKEAGRQLSTNQKNWYMVQTTLLGDKIKQEYPSTISEAFLASTDAFYFADAIQRAYTENRCLYSPLYDPLLPVYVAMDIGVNDLTVIIFFQFVHGEPRIFDYYEDKNKDVPFYAHFLQSDKKLLYHTIFLPHDSKKRDATDVQNTYERDFRRLFQHTSTRIHVLTRMDKQLSISHARLMIDRCVFNVNKVKKLIDNMSKYRKTWSEAVGRYTEEPFHNEASNYADAFRYVAQAISHLEAAGSLNGALEKHKKIVESRYRRVI